jgi:hypothetical protein
MKKQTEAKLLAAMREGSCLLSSLDDGYPLGRVVVRKDARVSPRAHARPAALGTGCASRDIGRKSVKAYGETEGPRGLLKEAEIVGASRASGPRKAERRCRQQGRSTEDFAASLASFGRESLESYIKSRGPRSLPSRPRRPRVERRRRGRAVRYFAARHRTSPSSATARYGHRSTTIRTGARGIRPRSREGKGRA